MVKKRIVFTGGSGRFGQTLKKNFDKSKFDIFFPTSKALNILNEKKIRKYLTLKKPKY